MRDWISEHQTSIIGVIAAAGPALNAFGVPVTEAQISALLGLVGAVLLLFTRRATVSVRRLQQIDGT